MTDGPNCTGKQKALEWNCWLWQSIEDSTEVPQVWRLGSEGSWTSHNGVFCKLSGGRDDFQGGRHGVLIWPDAFGLRAAMRDIAKRIAAEGYSGLVPNPFYRVAKAPVFQDVSNFDFQNPTDRAKLQPLTGSINAPGAAEKDASAYSAFLDAQKRGEQSRKRSAHRTTAWVEVWL